MFAAFAVLGGEAPAPVWDGHESVAEYAKRVNFPPTQTLDLGGGVKLELVLIPAGKFMMGTPEPTPVDEEGFQNKIVIGQALLTGSTVALLAMLTVVSIQTIRQKRRFQLSLGRLLLITVATGGCLLGGLHWRQSALALEKAHTKYAAEQARYNTAYAEEKPAHPVTLTQPLYMGKFAVTQDQWLKVTGQNPSRFGGKTNPVEQVSWDDAQEFCMKLTTQTSQVVRLPTEAEWEFACRAGTTTNYYSGDNETDLARVAWYGQNSVGATHPVGQKESNAFGLYDMHGNVLQWCQDWYDEAYYKKSESENPQGSAKGNRHLLRGGSFAFRSLSCRSAYRFWFTADRNFETTGFRVVLEPSFSSRR